MIELAIETALHACSAALLDEGRVVAERHEVIARGHAERLVPLIAELLLESGVRRADRIVVDVGPGSFTGIRVGIAAARALGLAWNAPVESCNSTALVAAGLLAERPNLDSVYVAFDASRGEVYCQSFDRHGATSNVAALAPLEAVVAARPLPVVGSGSNLLLAVDPTIVALDHPWPRAADVRHLPATARGTTVRPLYIRAPDAKVPA